MNTENIAINYCLDNITDNSNNEEIDNFMLDLSQFLKEKKDDECIYQTKLIYYNSYYTLKELLLITEYYGLTKTKKKNKYEIILNIINFELDVNNCLIVNKRKILWFYMNELKNDKMMKKYILW